MSCPKKILRLSHSELEHLRNIVFTRLSVDRVQGKTYKRTTKLWIKIHQAMKTKAEKFKDDRSN